MRSKDEPLYRSKPTAKSLWREYRLFGDRIELDSVPWGTVRVPLEDVKGVVVRPPVVIFDVLRGDYGLGDLLRAPKLDMADLHEHLALEKTGFWKQFRFTPEDPQGFKDAIDRTLAEFRERMSRR